MDDFTPGELRALRAEQARRAALAAADPSSS
jgi:hypothetical protein